MIVLDTNVVSELMNAHGDARVTAWYLSCFAATRLPATVLAELAFGVAKLPEGARKSRFAEALSLWRGRFADRMLPFGPATALNYGDVLAESQRAGRPMSSADAQIAATAREHGAALATRNGKDFATTGLRLVNPWAR